MNKQLKLILSSNSSALEQSNKDFAALYNIMFNQDGIIAEDSDGFRIRTYTYKQIGSLIEEASCALHKKIGATHAYVALCMENSVEWIVAFWAILRSGNKPYLVNCRHPHSLINSALKRLEIKYVLGTYDSQLDAEFIDIATLKTTDRFDGDFENEIALSTSATSLKEVICFYTGDRLSSQILNVRTFITKYPEIGKQYNGRIKNLAFLPFYHVFGLIAVYFWFTFFGQTIVFLNNYSSDTILKTCRKHEVTHIFAVPLLWHTIENAVQKKAKEGGEKKLNKLNKGIKLCTKLQNLFPHIGMYISQRIMHEVTDELFGRSVRFCVNGGSYIRQSAIELLNGIGYNLHNGYGMSEIGITSVDLRIRPKHRNLCSVGTPFNSVQYKIGNDNILYVKGTSVCNKLWIEGEPQSMEEWFNTGDIMEVKDGYYYINGRCGDVIIGENGENINPDTIEQNFSLPEAENFSVLGFEHNGKEQLSMVVQVGKYLSDSKYNALVEKIHAINETLPMTTRIQKFYYTSDALSSAGAVKVSRRYLLRAISNKDVTLHELKKRVVTENDEVTYSNEILSTVLSIVAKALDTEAESIDINAHIMLDLGADSICYFSILSALAEEFELHASEKEELRYTVHEFCQYIERHL